MLLFLTCVHLVLWHLCCSSFSAACASTGWKNISDFCHLEVDGIKDTPLLFHIHFVTYPISKGIPWQMTPQCGNLPWKLPLPLEANPPAFKVACSSSCLVRNAILVIKTITHQMRLGIWISVNVRWFWNDRMWHPPKLTVVFFTAKLRLKRSGKWVSKPIVLTRKPQLKHVEGHFAGC